MTKYIVKNADCIANMIGLGFIIFIFITVANIGPASSMSGARKQLRAKGTIETHNGKLYFLHSQEQQLESLDYLSLAKLAEHYDKGVIVISE